MSGNPNLCVDIFSSMANLLANFNSNQAIGNDAAFSHEGGFGQSNDVTANGPGGANFEETINGFI